MARRPARAALPPVPRIRGTSAGRREAAACRMDGGEVRNARTCAYGYAFTRGRYDPVAAKRLRRVGRAARQRQLDGELGAAALAAADPDRAAVCLDGLARDPQADAEAAEVAHRHGALEALEDPPLVLGRDADAAVAD